MTTSRRMAYGRCLKRRMVFVLSSTGALLVTAIAMPGAWAESSSSHLSVAEAPTVGGADVGEAMSTASAAPDDEEVMCRPGMTLVFHDEFNGSSLDTSVWTPRHDTYGDGNHELACLTPQNVTVSGGTLQITARRETVTCPGDSERDFTSGFIGTRGTGTYFPRYGRYEIRARVPHGQGLWPAFWLRHRDGASTAEVDIMEYFHSQVPGRSSQALHLDGVVDVTRRTRFFETPTRTPGWHTWAVEIRPTPGGAVDFAFFVDGVKVQTYTDPDPYWSQAHGNEPLFDMAINLAVGGNWVGRPDDSLGWLRDVNRCAQRGSGGGSDGCPTNGILRARFPNTYQVDYVRVWQITGGTGSS